MGVHVVQQITIQKSIQEISNYVFEPSNDPTWIGGIHEAKLLTNSPIGKGTQVQRIAKFLGKEIDYTLEVVEFQDQHLMVMDSIKSPFPMKVTYQLDESPNGTTMQVIVEGSSKGFYKLADFLMQPQVNRSIRGDLQRLKKLMEA